MVENHGPGFDLTHHYHQWPPGPTMDDPGAELGRELAHVCVNDLISNAPVVFPKGRRMASDLYIVAFIIMVVRCSGCSVF